LPAMVTTAVDTAEDTAVDMPSTIPAIAWLTPKSVRAA